MNNAPAENSWNRMEDLYRFLAQNELNTEAEYEAYRRAHPEFKMPPAGDVLARAEAERIQQRKQQRQELRANARAVCLTALQELAKKHGLSAQDCSTDSFESMTQAGFAIGCHVGLGMDVLAGCVIMGRNGYISSMPHGETYHSMLVGRNDGPGDGLTEDWERFISKGGCLAYVNFCHGNALSGNNFDSKDEEHVATLLSVLEIDNHSCVEGNALI